MAIARATGSSYPIIVDSVAPGTSITSGTFSTNEATALVVVTVGWQNFSGVVQHPLTVAWSGSTPAGASTFTKQVEFAFTGSGANAGGTSIWTATLSQTISAQAVVITPQTGDPNDSVSASIDILTGASTTMGVSNGQASAGGSSVARNVTLNGITAGSWIYVGAGSETFPLTVVDANTTQIDQTASTNGLVCAVGVNNTGTSGNINVGWAASAA